MAAGLTSVPKKRSHSPSDRRTRGSSSSRKGGGAGYRSEPEFGWQRNKAGGGEDPRDRDETGPSATAPSTSGKGRGDDGGDGEGFAGGWRAWEEAGDKGLGGGNREERGQEGLGSAESEGEEEEEGGGVW